MCESIHNIFFFLSIYIYFFFFNFLSSFDFCIKRVNTSEYIWATEWVSRDTIGIRVAAKQERVGMPNGRGEKRGYSAAVRMRRKRGKRAWVTRYGGALRCLPFIYDKSLPRFRENRVPHGGGFGATRRTRERKEYQGEEGGGGGHRNQK